MMKIRIQKSKDKFLVLFITDEKAEGKYLTKSELKTLKADIDSILEGEEDEIGDSL